MISAKQPVETDSSAAPTATGNDPLVVAAIAGDLNAQGRLVLRYAARLAGLVRAIVFDPSAVADIVQDSFVKMTRRIATLRDPKVFEGWLFALARNAATDFLRERRRWKSVFVLTDDGNVDAADSAYGSAVPELMEAFGLAITRLPASDRRIITLLTDGHSYREIAARTGLTVVSIRGRLCRMRPLLRRVIGDATGLRSRVRPPRRTLRMMAPAPAAVRGTEERRRLPAAA